MVAGRQAPRLLVPRSDLDPAPDGRNGKALRADSTDVERDPSWSADGRSIVFAADTGNGFDVYVAAAGGGEVPRLTSRRRRALAVVDARWPHHLFAPRRHQVEAVRYSCDVSDVHSDKAEPAAPFQTRQPTTSRRDGCHPTASASPTCRTRQRRWRLGSLDRRAEGGPKERVTRSRLVRGRGAEWFPTWSPGRTPALADFARAKASGRSGLSARSTRVRPPNRLLPRAAAPNPRLVSRRRRARVVAGRQRIAIAELPQPDPTYNGNPQRNNDEPPPLFAGADAFRLWTVDAPLPVDSGARESRRQSRRRNSGWRRSTASGKRFGGSTTRAAPRRPSGAS